MFTNVHSTPYNNKKGGVADLMTNIMSMYQIPMGDEVEFEYDWGKENGGKVTYGQDLHEFLFDYGTAPTEDDLNQKPDAIPYYPEGVRLINHEYVLSSGKKIKFDCMTGKGEQEFMKLPLDKQTKNAPLLCRNLHLEVDGSWEKVENFTPFTAKDMAEMRKHILSMDPIVILQSIGIIIWASSLYILVNINHIQILPHPPKRRYEN
jgi:hypothetical protein